MIMKAIQISKNGDQSVLKIAELPTPIPGKGEALVQIKAAGVNYIDIYMRTGRYAHELPFTPGFEAAGVVTAIGEGVSEVKVGDRVAYAEVLGSYAEYNVVPATKLIPLPNNLSFEEGAAFPLQAMTAHYLLHDYYHINSGDSVLVHAAAGGVGLLLVQWLRHLGATVIGTVSTNEKAQKAKAAGAHHIILYTEQDFVAETNKITKGKGIDFILDGVGKTTFTKDLEAARIHGHICLYGAASGPADPLEPNSLQKRSLTISGGTLFNSISTREELLMRANSVFEGLKAGWLQLEIGITLPLEEAAQAHSLLEGRKTTGKIILKVS